MHLIIRIRSNPLHSMHDWNLRLPFNAWIPHALAQSRSFQIYFLFFTSWIDVLLQHLNWITICSFVLIVFAVSVSHQFFLPLPNDDCPLHSSHASKHVNFISLRLMSILTDSQTNTAHDLCFFFIHPILRPCMRTKKNRTFYFPFSWLIWKCCKVCQTALR